MNSGKVDGGVAGPARRMSDASVGPMIDESEGLSGRLNIGCGDWRFKFRVTLPQTECYRGAVGASPELLPPGL